MFFSSLDSLHLDRSEMTLFHTEKNRIRYNKDTVVIAGFILHSGKYSSYNAVFTHKTQIHTHILEQMIRICI